MGYVKWSYETLNHFCGDVFKAFGFTEEESNQIKDVLLTADLYGIESHGMQRMVRYHKGIEKGTIHPQAKPEVVFETPISAVIDGHNGMGQLISVYAMKKAIEKAKKTGAGIVTVREAVIQQSAQVLLYCELLFLPREYVRSHLHPEDPLPHMLPRQLSGNMLQNQCPHFHSAR